MKPIPRIAVVFTLLLAGSWAALGFWIDHFAPVAEGEVVAKQERVAFLSSDRWKHEFIVRYRYRTDAAHGFEEGSHRVDAELFDRVAAGTPVAVRYVPWTLFRSRAGLDSALAGTHWWSRAAPLSSSSSLETFDVVLIAIAGLALWAAYASGARALAWLAAVVVGAVVYGILVLGALVWPAWLLLWRRSRPASVSGLVLTVVLGTIVLALRFPWPALETAAPVIEATGVVAQSHKGSTLWTNGRRSGDRLAQPFVLVDVEFVPNGGGRAIHLIDRVDDPGDRRYAKGARVRVEYPAAAPRDARIADATREFVAHSFTHFLLVWTLCGGIVVLLLGWAGIRIKQAVARRLYPSRAAWSPPLRSREFNPRQPKGD